jgi:hypothetical protein
MPFDGMKQPVCMKQRVAMFDLLFAMMAVVFISATALYAVACDNL